MTKSIPKKFTSLLPPIVAKTPYGKYLVITGTTHAGWYPIDDGFDYNQAIKGWTRWAVSTKEVQPTNDKKWKIANSKNNGFYLVSFNRGVWNCDCPGFGFRRKCRHIDEAKTKLN